MITVAGIGISLFLMFMFYVNARAISYSKSLDKRMYDVTHKVIK